MGQGRRWIGLFRYAFGKEAITDPGLGLDVLLLRTVLQFFAQLADEDTEIFGLLGRLGAPDRGQQCAMSKDLARIAREQQQEIEFLGGEMYGAAGDGDGVSRRVDDKVAHLDRTVAGAFGSAAEMGAHAGEELLDAEGFGDVVVGAGIEGFNLGVLLIAHRENEDGGTALAADGAAEFDTAHTGHGQIGDDQVRIPLLDEAQSLFRIVGGTDVVALGRQRGAQDARDLNFIVDYEDAFGHGPRSCDSRRGCGAAGV